MSSGNPDDPNACIACSHPHHEEYCITKNTNGNNACMCELLCGNAKCHKDEVCGHRNGKYYCECTMCTCKECKPKTTCGCTMCECPVCVKNSKCPGKCISKCSVA